MMRNIFLTGGTGLIGKTLIKKLSNDGHNLKIPTRKLDIGKEIISKLKIKNNLVNLFECDLLHPNSKQTVFNHLDNKIDTLIFNARSLQAIKTDQFGNLSDKQWVDEFYMGVIFPYQLSKMLIDNKFIIKDIVFISSIYGTVVPNPILYDNYDLETSPNYGVSKAAQIKLTKEMAIKFINNGIRVNCISFGGVEGRASDEFVKKYKKVSPNNKMLNDSDIYPALKFLLENEHLAINGENIKIDGGWTLI